jgi:hypothetical protein
MLMTVALRFEILSNMLNFPSLSFQYENNTYECAYRKSSQVIRTSTNVAKANDNYPLGNV